MYVLYLFVFLFCCCEDTPASPQTSTPKHRIPQKNQLNLPYTTTGLYNTDECCLILHHLYTVVFHYNSYCELVHYFFYHCFISVSDI